MLPSYLMEHQRRDVLHGLKVKRHLYANDTGTGKTVIGIELARAIRKKTLVVCPLSIIENAWMEDVARFASDISAVNLWKVMSTGKKRAKKREELVAAINDNDISIINFESFKRLWSTPREGGFALTSGEAPFQVLMIDESSRAKNNKAQVTKALIRFSDQVEYVYLFSGTPAPNNKLEYWPQVRMVSPRLFGDRFYSFRNRYFYPTGYGGYTWEPKSDKEEEFKEILSMCSSAVKKKDVLVDLPERSVMTRAVTLSKDEQSVYRSMLNEMYVMIEDEEITAANAAVKSSKLRQICSGFLIDEDKQVKQVGKSKTSELMDLLDDIGDRPVIIWTQFQHEAETIYLALRKKGKLVGRVDGTVSQGSKDAFILGFKNGAYQYLVAHPRSMGHGVTLTNCTDMVYFSLSYSLEEYLQSRDRIYRYGQKNACSYYFLTAVGTVEDAVIKAVTKKKNVAEEVIDYIKKHGGANARRSKQAA